MTSNNFKCHFCSECLGTGCVSELPGMGGVHNNINFQLNCAAWSRYTPDFVSTESTNFSSDLLPKIRLAPMTGAIENIGYSTEEHFYYDLIESAVNANIATSIGDGCPDYKFQYGVHAVRKQQETNPNIKSAVFIKPYSNDKIFQRIEWSSKIAEFYGIDIDSYNILTMRNQVQLEKKTSIQLKEIKKHLNVPFAIKGVFTKDDIELVKEVKPDIVVISNHGGRIDTRIGSTADFLNENGIEIANNCDKIIVDGGIRTYQDLLAARSLGAQEVLIGRPFASALCKDGINGIANCIEKLKAPQTSVLISNIY